MTVDIEKFEAVLAKVAALPFGPEWMQADLDAKKEASRVVPTLIAEHRRMVARIAELEYALQLADYALSGSNMNMNVVERKVRAALASKP